ncbi:MAG: response regulator transcription factor [Anaerolineales bacterium]
MRTRILLVDDDPTLSNLLGRFLRQSNFDLLEAPNGPAGLRMAYNERPDLVLLDVMMPGMDGWEVCARLRELSDVPVIMLTAKAAEADKLRGFQLGVDDYVTKPYSFVELVARIQAVLGRVKKERKEDGFIAHGEIVLNMEKYQATLGGRSLVLTPTEFRLLEVLVRGKGRVVSEADLIREVWGDERSDPALVRRYILMLRKKLEVDPAEPVWVRTVRGFGYRLGTGPLKLQDEEKPAYKGG